MSVRRARWSLCALTVILLLGLVRPALAQEPRETSPFHATPGRASRAGADLDSWIRRWNTIAIDASGLDHTPPRPGDNRTSGERLGPGKASHALAVVHLAMFEAVNAVEDRYESYSGLARARGNPSVQAAMAQAAHDALAAMFPSQRIAFAERLQEDLATLREGPATAAGIALGERATAAVLARRDGDDADQPEPRVGTDFVTLDTPGSWRPDPISQGPLAMGASWGAVRPFALRSGEQFRVAPPPALGSDEYAAAFDEVRRLGGDGVTTPTERTAEQTETGIYWAYDGTPSLCAPPRLYNQIAVHIAARMGTRGVDLARVLALVNVAMADAGIAIWESKYYYQFWRPVTGIREADAGTGPTGTGDGNLATAGDPTFTPLGAPASNLTGPNFTPPFPAYPSGHAGFGGAVFQMLRNIYGTDDIPFTFVSDELNGTTVDSEGNLRPLVPRSFTSLSQAEEENGQSRIYLGIHWSFDKTAGIAQGRHVADHVFRTVLRRRSAGRDGAPAR
jgi:hypothetical protein